MRILDAHSKAAARVGLLITALLLTATSLIAPAEAQSPAAEKIGACCTGQGDCQTMPWEKCSAHGKEATWLGKTHCRGIPCGACAHEGELNCRYVTEELCSDPEELFCADSSCAECIEQVTPPPPDDSKCMMHRVFRNDFTVLGDMATFHQFQNRIVVESEKGREMKDLFHEHMYELGLVLLRNPDLLWRGRALLQEAAPGFRELLDQPDGEQLVLTPNRVQTIHDFLADVAEHASPGARTALGQVQAEFEAVEGKSLREIRAIYPAD